MYPVALFMGIAFVNICIVFGLLWNINRAEQITVKIFGSLFSTTLSYLLAQSMIDGSVAVYWADGVDLVTEPVTSLSLHYVFLGCSVLTTLLFFVFTIGYFKYTVENSIS